MQTEQNQFMFFIWINRESEGDAVSCYFSESVNLSADRLSVPEKTEDVEFFFFICLWIFVKAAVLHVL